MERITGRLGLITSASGEQPSTGEPENGYLTFIPTGGGPILWGMIGNGFVSLQSTEEALDLLRAAYYQLGVPLAERVRMSELVRRAGFLPRRTSSEALWRSALTPFSRTEENDRDWKTLLREIRAKNRRPESEEAPGRPILLAQTVM